MPDETRPWQGTSSAPAEVGERYRWLSPVGDGGMAEVWRVRDTWLGREVVLKLQRAGSDAEAFLREARVVGRLAHSALVPVLDLGTMPDGRWFFTMPVVQGVPFEPRMEIRRGVRVLHQVCQAVAAAHDAGIVHRDLKPANILVGARGQVHLVDWGIAADRGAVVGRSGTARWASPEHAVMGPASPQQDVFSLGLLLRTLLCGELPWTVNEEQIWAALGRGERPSPPTVGPESLRGLCADCLAPVDRRLAHGGLVAAGLERWLDGADRRARAAELVSEADTVQAELERMAARASSLRRRAQGLLAEVRPWEGTERKGAAWLLEDEAASIEAALAYRRTERLGILVAALVQAPESTVARRRLSDLHADALVDAERAGEDASLHEVLLRQHDPERQRAWRSTGGAVSLRTDVPARVRAFPVRTESRRSVLGEGIDLGSTPLEAVELPAGSWMLLLSAPGCDEVRYPVHLIRNEHWDGVHPDGEARVVRMLAHGVVGPHERYVPCGWTVAGGDPQAIDPRVRKRVWVDGFIMARLPVTNAAYVDWLTSRARDGEDVGPWLPRTPDGQGAKGVPIVRWSEGAYRLPDGKEGDALRPDAPVVLVDVFSAEAYAAHHGARLPTAPEWEKAARGVDGRTFPWGDFVDPSFCCMLQSHEGRPLPRGVEEFPADVSPYGVVGLAGHAREWCANTWVRDDSDVVDQAAAAPRFDEGPREIRGGSWLSSERLVRAARRSGATPSLRKETVGFRLARSLPV